MPCTVLSGPFHVPVARKESRPGISMIVVASSPVTSPTVSTLNGAFSWVV